MAGDKNKKYTLVFSDTGEIIEVAGTDNVSANFKVYEIACPDTDVLITERWWVQRVQQFRNYLECPIDPNRWFSTIPHNKKWDGWEFSDHKKGLAIDIKFPTKYNKRQLLALAELIFGWGCSIRLYKSHLHIGHNAGEHHRWIEEGAL